MLTGDGTAARVASARVIPVVRMSTRANARLACDALWRAGMQALEITFTTPEAADLIAELRDAYPDIVVGAGTVRSTEEAKSAYDAGAQFVVSPYLATDVADLCRERNVPYMPGAMTPGEVAASYASGASIVKIFPAEQAGGPKFLKALRSVFPDVPLMPTGGITPQNLAAYFDAGAICVGMGGDLVPERLIANGDIDAVIETAKQTLAACQA